MRTRKLAFESCAPVHVRPQVSAAPPRRVGRRADAAEARRLGRRPARAAIPRQLDADPARPRVVVQPDVGADLDPAIDDAVAGTPSPKSQNRWASLPASVQPRLVFVPCSRRSRDRRPRRRRWPPATRSRPRRPSSRGRSTWSCSPESRSRVWPTIAPTPRPCSRSASSGSRSGARSTRCRSPGACSSCSPPFGE